MAGRRAAPTGRAAGHRRRAAVYGIGLIVGVPAALALGTGEAGHAHEGATGVVKQRMESMKSMRAANKEILDMLRRRRPFDAVRIAALARSMREQVTQFPGLFPKGTEGPPSEALPAVWSKPADFRQAARQAASRAGDLAEAAKAGDRAAILRAFSRFGRTCSGCHANFRQRK